MPEEIFASPMFTEKWLSQSSLEDLFAASIRGGRKDQNKYNELIRFLSSKVQVLTEHVGDSSLNQTGEQNRSDKEIYQRDLEWLKSADAVIAEVTTFLGSDMNWELQKNGVNQYYASLTMLIAIIICQP